MGAPDRTLSELLIAELSGGFGGAQIIAGTTVCTDTDDNYVIFNEFCGDSADETSPTSEESPRHTTFRAPAIHKLNVEVGRNIGYDYAKMGMTLPYDAPQPLIEGYKSAQHRCTTKSRELDFFSRKWLRLRYSAWRRNRVFDNDVTPEYLTRIYTDVCPILRIPFTKGSGDGTTASIDRVFNDSAYAVGNLVFMSVKANIAKANRTLQELRDISMLGTDFEGLSSIEWKRLASLANVMHVKRASLMVMPLYLFPPPCLIIGNPSIIIQASISMAACGRESSKFLPLLRKIIRGKTPKKHFDAMVRILEVQICKEFNSTGGQNTFKAIENTWHNKSLFHSFSKWYDSLDIGQLYKMVGECRNIHRDPNKWSKENTLESWRMETRGYDR